MKTQYRTAQFRIVSSILSLPLVLCALVITAALAPQPAKAVSIVGYTLNLTEVTSTNLTATYNGPGATFSVVNTGIDAWTVTYALTPSSSFSLSDFTLNWTEPEEPDEVNQVSHGILFGNGNTLYVTSDVSYSEYDGISYPNGTLVQVGTDNSQPVFLRFDDRAALNETAVGVPESGSTLALFGLSISGLVLLTRFRQLQSV